MLVHVNNEQTLITVVMEPWQDSTGRLQNFESCSEIIWILCKTLATFVDFRHVSKLFGIGCALCPRSLDTFKDLLSFAMALAFFYMVRVRHKLTESRGR